MNSQKLINLLIKTHDFMTTGQFVNEKYDFTRTDKFANKNVWFYKKGLIC